MPKYIYKFSNAYKETPSKTETKNPITVAKTFIQSSSSGQASSSSVSNGNGQANGVNAAPKIMTQARATATSSSNSAVTSLNKQLTRFNGEQNMLDEDRTQSFLTKVNAHIANHIKPPEKTTSTKQLHQQQLPKQAKSNTSSGSGFFLHSNIYLQKQQRHHQPSTKS